MARNGVTVYLIGAKRQVHSGSRTKAKAVT